VNQDSFKKIKVLGKLFNNCFVTFVVVIFNTKQGINMISCMFNHKRSITVYLNPCPYLMLHQMVHDSKDIGTIYLLKAAATDILLHRRCNPKSKHVLLQSPVTHALSKL